MSSTLEELWLSYNQITSLDGLSGLSQLTTLYLSNNLIKAWNELDKLVSKDNNYLLHKFCLFCHHLFLVYFLLTFLSHIFVYFYFLATTEQIASRDIVCLTFITRFSYIFIYYFLFLFLPHPYRVA